MNNDDIIKGMTGASLIGSLLTETRLQIDIIPFVLNGTLDDKLYRGFHLIEYGVVNYFVEGDPKILSRIADLKDHLRSFVQAIFEQAERVERWKQQERLRLIKQELKTSNRPHEFGTVAEIAEKFNISKSEVRRRKADGTLDELLLQKS